MAKIGINSTDAAGLLKDSVRTNGWALCIGAGTSLPLVPSWGQLVRNLLARDTTTNITRSASDELLNTFGPDALLQAAASDVVIIDDMTQWASRMLRGSGDARKTGFRAIAEAAADIAISTLFESLDEISATVIVVSSEVGSGVSPRTRLGNVFADVLGVMNRRVAERSDEAHLLVSGIPVRLK